MENPNNSVLAKADANTDLSTDLWSVAYHEALLSFGEEVNLAILKGQNIKDLLTGLEKTNEELAGESLFRRGVQRLQNPMKYIKLALDLASPLARLQPIASTAVGVLSLVTAVSLS